MPMRRFTVDTDDSAFGQKIVEGTAFGIRAFQCPRHEIPKVMEKGVYLLLDDRHSLCYVGESGKGAAGISARISSHVNQKESWWTHAVFFVGAFDSYEDMRYWIEWRLFDLAKPHFAVVSTAAAWKKPVPEGGEEILEKILMLCALLGLPFSRPSLPPQIRPNSTSTEPSPNKNHNVSIGKWPSFASLARAISDELNGGKGADGIALVLKNFWCPSTRKWSKAGAARRKMLESVGVEFDRDGFVKSCAKVPYPLAGKKRVVQPRLPL